MILLNAMSLQETGVQQSFQDVKADHWAAGAIAKVQALGWMSGYPDGKFRPDEKLTQAEAVAVMNGLLQRPKAVSTVPWNDIQEHDWFSQDVQSASVKLRIIRFKNGSERVEIEP